MTKKRFIPTLWKYFLGQYFEVLLLSLFAFVVILLSTKLQDFAHFVSMGAPLHLVGLFVLYQIPYVMQIALPISSLIGSLYLFQRLSQNNALAAARASGMSVFGLVTPLLLCSFLFSLIVFRCVLDVGASSHRAGKQLEFELRKLHPLAIINNTKLLEQSGISIDMQGSLEHDRQASQFILAARYGEQGQLALIIAKKMKVKDDIIFGEHMALITEKPSDREDSFDHLLIENIKKNEMKLEDLALVANTKKLRIGNDDLHFSYLLAKRKDLQTKIAQDVEKGEKSKFNKKQLAKCESEIARRISLAASIFTFALLGMSYGCLVGRVQSKRRLIPVIALTALFLICYLGGKAMESDPSIYKVLYTAPHLAIICVCIRRLVRIDRGVEG